MIFSSERFETAPLAEQGARFERTDFAEEKKRSFVFKFRTQKHFVVDTIGYRNKLVENGEKRDFRQCMNNDALFQISFEIHWR